MRNGRDAGTVACVSLCRTVIESVTANSSKERGVTYDTMYGQYLDYIQGGVFIYKVMVSDGSPVTPDGIQHVGQTSVNTPWHTLAGVTIDYPATAGIYVKEGRKWIMK